MNTVTLSLFRFDRTVDRLWVLAMMGAARLPLSRVPGLRFFKLCGSGTGEGFTPIPNMGVWAILCSWDNEKAARTQIEAARIFQRFRNRANEHWTVFLTPTSVRGEWSGQTPFEAGTPDTTGPIAALTRATIKPSVALQFWQRVPDISAVIGKDPNVMFKVGIGEVPWFHQVTFSIWPDAESMASFARHNGPHAEAIAAVRSGKWFREELYARFRIAGDQGTWNGKAPLAQAKDQAA